MSWESITAIISVITVGIAVGRIIYGLSQTLTRLNCSVENLNATLNDLMGDNEREHEELYGELSSLRDEITEIEEIIERDRP